MGKKKFWLWVDGQKRYYDYPPEPPGYTLEELVIMQWVKDYFEKHPTEQRVSK